MSMSFDQYMKDMVQPMRDELTRLGIQSRAHRKRLKRVCRMPKEQHWL